MSFSLQDFFDFPYKEGYVRWPDNGKCIYIPEAEAKRMLLEDLQSVKFIRLENSN
jgi:hypothetical protein